MYSAEKYVTGILVGRIHEHSECIGAKHFYPGLFVGWNSATSKPFNHRDDVR